VIGPASSFMLSPDPVLTTSKLRPWSRTRERRRIPGPHDFHHSPEAVNVRRSRNESSTRLGGDEATLRKDFSFVCRYVELRRRGRVDQLVEARVKIGIGEQSILVTPDVVEHHGPLCGCDDQSSLFIDGVSYFHFSAPFEHVFGGTSQETPPARFLSISPIRQFDGKVNRIRLPRGNGGYGDEAFGADAEHHDGDVLACLALVRRQFYAREG
jgi:hypothetical protein